MRSWDRRKQVQVDRIRRWMNSWVKEPELPNVWRRSFLPFESSRMRPRLGFEAKIDAFYPVYNALAFLSPSRLSIKSILERKHSDKTLHSMQKGVTMMGWDPFPALLFLVSLSSPEFEMRGMSCRATSDVTDVPSRSALLQRSNQHDDTDNSLPAGPSPPLYRSGQGRLSGGLRCFPYQKFWKKRWYSPSQGTLTLNDSRWSHSHTNRSRRSPITRTMCFLSTSRAILMRLPKNATTWFTGPRRRHMWVDHCRALLFCYLPRQLRTWDSRC